MSRLLLKRARVHCLVPSSYEIESLLERLLMLTYLPSFPVQLSLRFARGASCSCLLFNSRFTPFSPRPCLHFPLSFSYLHLTITIFSISILDLFPLSFYHHSLLPSTKRAGLSFISHSFVNAGHIVNSSASSSWTSSFQNTK